MREAAEEMRKESGRYSQSTCSTDSSENSSSTIYRMESAGMGGEGQAAGRQADQP